MSMGANVGRSQRGSEVMRPAVLCHMHISRRASAPILRPASQPRGESIMKRSLIAVAIALTTTAASAGSPSGDSTFDRSLPTYPELGMASGVLVASGPYRMDAGNPTYDQVVQDYGSA